MAEPWPIDGERLFEFLSDQLVNETGVFSKGVNKGLNIARSAIRNVDAVEPIDPETLPIVQELQAQVKRVTAERDAAIKDRAELANFELTVCEQFCFGDRKHDIPPCEWNRFGKCQLREWRGLVAENATAESEVQADD